MSHKNTDQSIPKISVVMSVYNGEDYLRPAIDSILNQTYRDFEFIIIDDGSTDSSKKIIESYKDSRIRLISRKNHGLTYSLNEGLKLARAEYIARQDADDISLPHRFEKEVAFLDSHPDVGLVGSNYIAVDKTAKKVVVVSNVFMHHDDLKACLVLCNQYGHGSIMMRKSAIEKVAGIKGYDKKVGHVEDYDLWVRLSRVSKVANIEDPLYKYRKVDTSVSHSKLEEQVQLTFKVRDKAFQHYLKHKHEYKPFRFHPSGKNYMERKSTMYRDYAYLARINDKPLLAIKFLIAAIICQPKLKRNYKYLVIAVYKPLLYRWRFDWL